jgi:pimeloyl-ACP methyl ester carboxylesterase
VLYLLQGALSSRPPHLRRATLVAESFGGCLALRMALAAPQLVSNLVLLNPATSFAGSLGGLSSFVSATNLLALFPKDLYTTAQTVLMPLLVGGARHSEAAPLPRSRGVSGGLVHALERSRSVRTASHRWITGCCAGPVIFCYEHLTPAAAR